MFLRSTNRRKDGKDHRYFSVVENRRLPGGKTAQRTVLYLGEINDRQQASWRKTLDVFDEAEQRFTSMSLFPDDRDLPRKVKILERAESMGDVPTRRTAARKTLHVNCGPCNVVLLAFWNAFPG